MNWSAGQDDALRVCSRWLRDKDGPQVFYLAGYAGTGKTTLARHLVDDQWLFAAYTGKASHVLRQKGCPGATTIHSLIYRPNGESKAQEIRDIDKELLIYTMKETLDRIEQERFAFLMKLRDKLLQDKRPRFTLWSNSPMGDRNVVGVVVDEVSMVDQRLAEDLESFGKKILVLGDPAQLPPVGAGGYYTNRHPDVMLTDVHRHARESGILRLATMIREGEQIDYSQNSADVEILYRETTSRSQLAAYALEADQVLVGLNATRKSMNTRYRELLGFEDPTPAPNDRLVCLKNDHSLGLFNGSQWKVKKADSDTDQMVTIMELESEDMPGLQLEVGAWLHHMMGIDRINRSFDNDDFAEFDWSYALTVHKAQGSQWDHVMLYDQSGAFRADRRKWLYTGVTRASKKLRVIL